MSWLFDPALPLGPLWRGLILAVAALLWAVLLTRIVGLRSFSKMTAFDFVMTIAMGSLLATAAQAAEAGPFLQPMAAMAGLFAVQYALARLRRASDRARRAIENEPVLLMRDGQVDEAALRRTRVARDDLIAKLREADVGSLSEVRAVVLETTGTISVLTGAEIDSALLSGVVRAGDGAPASTLVPKARRG